MEYLQATGNQYLLEFISQVTPANEIPDAIHQMGLKCVREYMVLDCATACCTIAVNHQAADFNS